MVSRTLNSTQTTTRQFLNDLQKHISFFTGFSRSVSSQKCILLSPEVINDHRQPCCKCTTKSVGYGRQRCQQGHFIVARLIILSVLIKSTDIQSGLPVKRHFYNMHTVKWTLWDKFMRRIELSFDRSLWKTSFSNEKFSINILVSFGTMGW